MGIITIASSKGGAGKTTIARMILARLAASKQNVGAIDGDLNRTLTDWVEFLKRGTGYKIDVVNEIDETKIVEAISSMSEKHKVVVIDTAGAASQATLFAIGCADLVLVPVQTSAADLVEAIKTARLVESASQLTRRKIPVRVVLNSVQPGTHISEHIEREAVKAGLPLLPTKISRLVAFAEMTFSGQQPTGTAGQQADSLINDLDALNVL